jgi:hypothetical protein
MFQWGIFNAKRANGSLVIDSPIPLCDIFYLLQTLLPGMLLIYRIDDMDDLGERETTCGLPPLDWIKERNDLFQKIFEDSERYDCLLAARGYMWETTGYQYYNDEQNDDYCTDIYGLRTARDYTACSSDCGYCGACDY